VEKAYELIRHIDKHGRPFFRKRWLIKRKPLGSRRAEGTNPRALGTNPRAKGTNPKATT